MTRTVDLANRSKLLERVAAYVLDHGLADLSLRPLAEAVESSPRTLLYHFGSKERIVAAVLRGIRERQQALFARLGGEQTTPVAICRAAWAYMSDPAVGPALRLFFETYALALRAPERFPGFLEGAVEDWLRFLAAPLLAQGMEPARARAFATVVLGGYRGFMLDYAATGDAERVGAAIDLWSAALHALEPAQENDDAHAP
ncbi:MAG TPA: TetR/AcrR family transcriptional regulator [Candidatus Sulfotelmatobacter sp.]|nr:TetR/AcrR family transcriptional regulator [Candidatus Sulfotelmatobacter sp.]